MSDWWAQIPMWMVACLGALTVASAFFSAGETALFALTHSQRASMRRSGKLSALAVEALLADSQALLVTVLLGNVTVNALYFAIGGAMAVQIESRVGQIVVGGIQVFWIILFGEVVPKVIASIARVTVAGALSPLLWVIHGGMGPLRVVIMKFVMRPISRLVGVQHGTAKLTTADLSQMIAAGEESGALSRDEELFLRRLMVHRRLRVRDVMTPRTEIASVREGASRAEVVASARRGRVRRLVVTGEDLDDARGILDVKGFLANPESRDHAVASSSPCVEKPVYVPEVASLEQLGELFRSGARDLAIVVDEFGGTAGIVAVEDSLEQLLGDITARGEEVHATPVRSIDGTTIFDGRTSLADFAHETESTIPEVHASTVGGLVTEVLGRLPHAGDTVRFAGWRWRVLSASSGRATAVEVSPDRGVEGPPR
ncbi:MAG: hemolysin family protein [Planctomycetota bacterium]|nr:hemolysin family protein [Planctomycetota bacterium]